MISQATPYLRITALEYDSSSILTESPLTVVEYDELALRDYFANGVDYDPLEQDRGASVLLVN